MTDSMHQPWPSVRYHRSGKTALVHSEEHHDELLASDPDNWADTPAAFAEPATAIADAEAGVHRVEGQRFDMLDGFGPKVKTADMLDGFGPKVKTARKR